MGDCKGLLEEKLTPTRATSLSEKLLSGLSGSEINFIEPPVIKQDIMGSSIQPSRAASSINLSGDIREAQGELPKLDDSRPMSLRSSSTCTTYSLEISSSKESRPLPVHLPSKSEDLSTNPDPNPSTSLSLRSKREKPDTDTSSHRPVTFRHTQSLEHSDEFNLNLCTEKLERTQMEPKMSPVCELKQTITSSPITDEKLGAQPFSAGFASKATPSQNLSEASGDWRDGQEEEPQFYAFVILHDQADSDEAVRLKTRMESISSMKGATFAEDFAEPGRSTFSCIEDAIENSAYVMLLLTPNFDTHLNETSADSALMNSIEKPHKYNTVIPLIPLTTGSRPVRVPLVLKTKNPLEETNNRDNFKKKVQMVLSPSKIERQKEMWRKEQALKSLHEKEKQLREDNRLKKKTNKQETMVRKLEEENMKLNMPWQRFPPPFACQPSQYQAFYRPEPSYGPGPMPPYHSGSMNQQPPSSIYIQNAKYIMVGDNSSMTVGDAVVSEDEDIP